jgi:hypothetical protein
MEQEHIHIERSDSAVGDGAADGAGEGELGVELEAARLGSRGLRSRGGGGRGGGSGRHYGFFLKNIERGEVER